MLPDRPVPDWERYRAFRTVVRREFVVPETSITPLMARVLYGIAYLAQPQRILGVGIVGHGAGELIAEGVVAVEMGATAKDLALCVHPHPTLSETLMEAAEVFYGYPTHTFVKKPPQKQAAS